MFLRLACITHTHNNTLHSYDSQSFARVQQWVTASKVNITVEPIESAGVSEIPYPFYQFLATQYPNATLTRILWEAGTFPESDYTAYVC
jgi:hypothetical protein